MGEQAQFVDYRPFWAQIRSLWRMSPGLTDTYEGL